ncbi:MAG: hypothetical protein M0037_13385 [Betaproteobacteria bacterium]|nr:hypothetical protein [Betaproteobacteria bacterium]
MRKLLSFLARLKARILSRELTEADAATPVEELDLPAEAADVTAAMPAAEDEADEAEAPLRPGLLGRLKAILVRIVRRPPASDSLEEGDAAAEAADATMGVPGPGTRGTEEEDAGTEEHPSRTLFTKKRVLLAAAGLIAALILLGVLGLIHRLLAPRPGNALNALQEQNLRLEQENRKLRSEYQHLRTAQAKRRPIAASGPAPGPSPAPAAGTGAAALGAGCTVTNPANAAQTLKRCIDLYNEASR